VLITISDKKIGVDANGDGAIDYYNADIVTANDYYAFGSQMPGRIFVQGNNKYRYGFNGKENDNEVKGTGNQQDYGKRIYDPRLGKFLSVDPLASKFPHMSPYAAMDDDPINKTDPDGQEPIKPQAGTVSGFIAFLNNTSSKMGTLTGGNAQDALRRLAKINWSWGKPTPATTAPFNLQKDRYIYTEKGGWIDMSHFMFYAGTAYKYKEEKQAAQEAISSMEKAGGYALMGITAPLIKTANQDPVGEAVQDGYMQERTDKIFAKYSAYSYEDLPTDKFAADFGANHFDPKSKLTLGEQIQNYLNNNLKATTPDKAPNYKALPTKDPTDKPSRTNTTTNPIFTKDNP